ncbi:hypothetical protein BGZ49_004651, partial [Haplosporangium sp. Z 27]
MSGVIPEISPVILPDTILHNVNKLNTDAVSCTDFNMTSPPPSTAINVASAVDAIETNAPALAQTPDILDESNVGKESLPAPSEENMPASSGTYIAKEEEQDSVEQNLLMELEELKKEKSRLFSLFRASLQKKDETPPPTTQQSQPTEISPISVLDSVSTLSSVAEEEPQPKSMTVEPLPLFKTAYLQREMDDVNSPDRNDTGSNNSNMKDDSRRKPINPRRPSDQGYDRRAEPPLRPNYKRREQGRLIDRSKLNLEIPRKPSIPSSASASSNSTASTPTPTNTAFSLHHQHHHPYQIPQFSSSSTAAPFLQKGKRQRSVSPPIPYGPVSSRGGGPGERFGERFGASGGDGGRGSNAGPFGPSYSDSTPPNKHPRANMGSHGRSHSSGGSGNNNNNSNNNNYPYNVLPEKPQVRHAHHHQQHSNGPSHSTNLSTSSSSSYHGGDDGYQRGKHGNGSGGQASSSFSNMNGSNNNNNSGGSGGGNAGSYRQGGPVGYPPPTRIGFGNGNSNGNNNNNNNSNNNNNNSNNSGNNTGPGNSGRGGYYGHGDGGANGNNSGGNSISKFGPPGRPSPFNRNTMQIPHARGMVQNRNGFGGGGGRPGGGNGNG